MFASDKARHTGELKYQTRMCTNFRRKRVIENAACLMISTLTALTCNCFLLPFAGVRQVHTMLLHQKMYMY